MDHQNNYKPSKILIHVSNVKNEWLYLAYAWHKDIIVKIDDMLEKPYRANLGFIAIKLKDKIDKIEVIKINDNFYINGTY